MCAGPITGRGFKPCSLAPVLLNLGCRTSGKDRPAVNVFYGVNHVTSSGKIDTKENQIMGETLAELTKRLHRETDHRLLVCRDALVKSGLNYDKAKQLLRDHTFKEMCQSGFVMDCNRTSKTQQ